MYRGLICRINSSDSASRMNTTKYNKLQKIIISTLINTPSSSAPTVPAAVPVSDVDGDQIIQVETAPLFHILRAGGAEERPAHLCARARLENGRQLLPEALLAVLKELVRLVHHQPLHADQRQAPLETHSHRQSYRGRQTLKLLFSPSKDSRYF